MTIYTEKEIGQGQFARNVTSGISAFVKVIQVSQMYAITLEISLKDDTEDYCVDVEFVELFDADECEHVGVNLGFLRATQKQ
jgi:hypothetical protein